MKYFKKAYFELVFQTVLVESAVFDYKKNKNSLRAHMPCIISVVIPMEVTVLVFRLLFLQARLTSVASQAT